MNLRTLAVAAAALSALAFPAAAETISTHVLDLARGVGGRDVPVTLQIKSTDGGWRDLATSRTNENGRVRSFGDAIKTEAATYRLVFDMSRYGEPTTPPFFPEIDVVFQVVDPSVHYHVPVVVSPYGYSTYRGN